MQILDKQHKIWVLYLIVHVLVTKVGRAIVRISMSSNIEGRELLEEYFIGAVKEANVQKYLRCNEFRLYYRLPNSRKKIANTLPLKIGYMSSRGKVRNSFSF